MMGGIDYDALKKRGFLRQRQEGFFLLRTRMSSGNYKAEQLSVFSDIAGKYGRGIVHATTRQGLEIPFIRFEDIDAVEREISDAGINPGTSGPRLRTTTCCPGNNWCKSGLINTFELYDKIEKDLGMRCAMDLPHKFKIAISGCPNTCTRPQTTEIGIHGQIDPAAPKRRVGYAVYLGGCGGRTPHTGFKCEKVFTEEEVLRLVERVVRFYKANAKPRQRLALLIKEVGREKFLREIEL
jgi:dissimilatory sulfite reductase (desulfoviridin) alpha/beta subunit